MEKQFKEHRNKVVKALKEKEEEMKKSFQNLNIIEVDMIKKA